LAFREKKHRRWIVDYKKSREGGLRSIKEFANVRAFQDQIGIWKCWFLRSGKTGVSEEKPLGAE